MVEITLLEEEIACYLENWKDNPNATEGQKIDGRRSRSWSDYC